MKEKNNWKVVTKFYWDNFKIPSNIVNLMADRDILLMSVSGSSNENISKILDIDKNVVRKVIKYLLSFNGWDDDLFINPISIFNRVRNSGKHLYKDFKNEIETLDIKESDEEMIKIMYRSCKRYENISRTLDKNWF